MTQAADTARHWLMKAEAESRLEKGHEVKFSVDDFEARGSTHWDGVRSAAASKSMRERMRVGDGDTAWDPEHPYYDAKTDKAKPTWYMVDVDFRSRLAHFVSLKLLQHLAAKAAPPPEVDYLTADHLAAIKAMALLSRGRLSVQPVSPLAYEAVCLLGERGGFDELVPAKEGKKAKAATETAPSDAGTAPAAHVDEAGPARKRRRG